MKVVGKEHDGERVFPSSHPRQAPRSSAGVRRGWNENDLFTWWIEAQSQDPLLVWERSSGDPRQHVPGFCKGLIGPAAI